MYVYYAGCLRSYHVQPYITAVQITQLLFSVILELYTLVYPIHPMYRFYSFISLMTASVYFLSFVAYYYRRYMNTPKHKSV